MARWIFKIALRWSVSGMILCDSNDNFERFRKKGSLFQKTGVRFLIERINFENAIFSYKTALSEANVKTNKMQRTKYRLHKERSFASNYSIFENLRASISVLDVDLMYELPKKCPYSQFSWALKFYLRVLFSP